MKIFTEKCSTQISEEDHIWSNCVLVSNNILCKFLQF